MMLVFTHMLDIVNRQGRILKTLIIGIHCCSILLAHTPFELYWLHVFVGSIYVHIARRENLISMISFENSASMTVLTKYYMDNNGHMMKFIIH